MPGRLLVPVLHRLLKPKRTHRSSGTTSLHHWAAPRAVTPGQALCLTSSTTPLHSLEGTHATAALHTRLNAPKSLLLSSQTNRSDSLRTTDHVSQSLTATTYNEPTHVAHNLVNLPRVSSSTETRDTQPNSLLLYRFWTPHIGPPYFCTPSHQTWTSSALTATFQAARHMHGTSLHILHRKNYILLYGGRGPQQRLRTLLSLFRVS
jgi:hypothetical protein